MLHFGSTPTTQVAGVWKPNNVLKSWVEEDGGKADVNQPDSTIVILFQCSIDLKNELGNHFLPSPKLAVNRVSFGDASYVGFKVYKLTAANFHFCECVFQKKCDLEPMHVSSNATRVESLPSYFQLLVHFNQRWRLTRMTGALPQLLVCILHSRKRAAHLIYVVYFPLFHRMD